VIAAPFPSAAEIKLANPALPRLAHTCPGDNRVPPSVAVSSPEPGSPNWGHPHPESCEMREVQRRRSSPTTSQQDKEQLGPDAAPPSSETDPYLAAANKVAAQVMRRHTAARPASGKRTMVRRRTNYAALQPRMRGNNDLRVYEEGGFHISIVDPQRTNQFDEFHVTVENNTNERNAHFFYDDTGKYLKAKSEGHAQSKKYREDFEAASLASVTGVDANQRLRPFDTLENVSSYASKGFLNVVESAKQTTAGNTGIKVVSNNKAPVLPPEATAAQRMGAKPRPWTKAEAEEWAATILARVGADAGTFSAVAPVDNGLRVSTFITVNDAAEMGQSVLNDVKGMGPTVFSAAWGKPAPPAPLPTTPPVTGGTVRPTAPPSTGPAPSTGGTAPTSTRQPAPTGGGPRGGSGGGPRGGGRGPRGGSGGGSG